MPLRLSHRYILEGSRNPVLQEICFLVDRYNREFRDAPSWAAKTSQMRRRRHWRVLPIGRERT
jgi:hypothetical protein